MKLDVNVLKFLAKDDFRVLTAVEVGQKNHELVPLPLIESIAALRTGGTQRAARNLLRYKLLHHDSSKYDGYRLTPLGYDYLAIKALVNRGAISSVGSQIGVGKESDVFEVMNDEGEVMALKVHRLGRTSFRAVKSKRDYLKHRSSFSWLYLSRLAAAREYSFMVALAEQGLPVPTPIDHNRHCVLMSLVDAIPLAQVQELHEAGNTFHDLMALMERLTRLGLVHCDYNEFNLLVDTEDTVTLIDFPQMVSVSHENAQELFDRDVDCVIKFFKTKIGYIPEQDQARPWKRPCFQELCQRLESRLDIDLQASGHPKLGKGGKAVSSGRSPLDPDVAVSADSDAASEADSEAISAADADEEAGGSEASSSVAPAYDEPTGDAQPLAAAAADCKAGETSMLIRNEVPLATIYEDGKRRGITRLYLSCQGEELAGRNIHEAGVPVGMPCPTFAWASFTPHTTNFITRPAPKRESSTLSMQLAGLQDDAMEWFDEPLRCSAFVE
ncbi:hypothetical protein WJX74_003707 [Apatococcus lobatus]|uniref:Serine/threonine-protein kinase RIO2 n=1 Tax=Apatococcus lobatus TaxID=904363 RepID=A0AAW1QK37_9CHLO